MFKSCCCVFPFELENLQLECARTRRLTARDRDRRMLSTLGDFRAGQDSSVVTSSFVERPEPKCPGDTIVAGAHGTNRRQVSVYVFIKSGGKWVNGTEAAQLTIPQEKTPPNLGSAVAISANGTIVLAGAGTISGDSEGAAYMFAKPPSGWATTTNYDRALHTPDGAAFAESLSISGHWFLVGARDQVVNSQSQGAAFIFGRQ